MSETKKLVESISNNLNEASRRGHTVSEFLSDSELAEYWEDRITSPNVSYAVIGDVLDKTFDWIMHESSLEHPEFEGTDKEFDAIKVLFPALMKSGLEFGIDKTKLETCLDYFNRVYVNNEDVPDEESPWADKYNHNDDVNQDIKTLLDGIEKLKNRMITEEGEKTVDDYLYSALSNAMNDLGLEIDDDTIG